MIKINQIDDIEKRDELLNDYGGSNEFLIEVDLEFERQEKEKCSEALRKYMVKKELIEITDFDYSTYSYGEMVWQHLINSSRFILPNSERL
ncbi:hypothetical protein [Erysipelothrix aquatica]|uniref:hypothetical protein n=1 Tax=Erysipelothrix aquatica TaxID=2683714 RepID=UPI0013568479|nr:hypothetical protein [Erysipelothrix aquatica]